MSYLPLEMLKAVNETEDLLDCLKKDYDLQFTRQEYIDYMVSLDFMSQSYDGKFKKLNDYAIEHVDELIDICGLDKSCCSPRTEWQDVYLAPVLWKLWSENKQVYAPDADFANALVSTKNLKLSRYQLEHLPCNCLYLDLENVETFSFIGGCLIYIRIIDNQVSIIQYMLSYEQKYYSFVTGGIFDENDMLVFDRSLFIKTGIEKSNNDPIFSQHNLNKGEIAMFGLQMLSYLASKEPDIVENPITKKTYRKPTVIKNKFSEIQKHDVGIRYGKSIRTKVAEAKREYEKTYSGEERHRKPPTPHFRCAHWQRFWVGEGRKKCINKWVEPCFVGFGIGDVVIHKVV